MDTEWSISRELLLTGADVRRSGIGRALAAELRSAVQSGRLRPGERLPSSRDLSIQLGIARGTVTGSYDQLVAEGLLVARRGAGTVVAHTTPAGTADGDSGSATETDTSTLTTARPSKGANPASRYRVDLHPGRPALSAFPRQAWVKATRQAMAALPEADLDYGDGHGLVELRQRLRSYSARVRGIDASADQLVVVSGTAQGLTLTGRVLAADGHRTIAVEDPGHPESSEQLSDAGLQVVPVPVDEHGLVVEALDAVDVKAVVVTPAHQSPMGVPMAPERRRQLIAWAIAGDAVIVEDDYDAEYRYDRAAIAAVQALAPAHTIHLSSLSKTFAPAVRLGWAVVPPALLEAFRTAKRRDDLGTSPLLQATVSALIGNGEYERHLRRTRTMYRRRRRDLIDALAERLPAWRVTGMAAGLHVVVRLPDGADADALSERLAASGVNAPPLSSYVRGSHGPPFPGLVLGFAGLTPGALSEAVAAFGVACET